jgi:hypothetical protein
MKTMFAFVAALALPITALACSSAPPDTQTSDVPSISPSGVHSQAINQGGCTTQQLLWGWFEVDGECYGPGDPGGGSGDPGGGTSTCFNRCSSANDKCYQRCDQRGSADTCYAACDRTLTNCFKICH